MAHDRKGSEGEYFTLFNPKYVRDMIKRVEKPIKNVYDKLGPFKIKKNEVPMLLVDSKVSIEFRKHIMKIDNGYYCGEWTVGDEYRHGRGVFFTEDKNLYEGFWINNKRNGRGRLITPT